MTYITEAANAISHENTKTQIQNSNNFNDKQHDRNARNARNAKAPWITLIYNHIQMIKRNKDPKDYLSDISGVTFYININNIYELPIEFGYWNDPKPIVGGLKFGLLQNNIMTEYILIMNKIMNNKKYLSVKHNIVYIVSRLFFIRSVIVTTLKHWAPN